MTANSKLFGGSRKFYWSLSRELQQLDADCEQQNLKLFEGFGKLSVFSKESEMLLLRMIGRNGVGGGTSMHFARREVEPFSCVSCFVIGLLTSIWKHPGDEIQGRRVQQRRMPKRLAECSTDVRAWEKK